MAQINKFDLNRTLDKRIEEIVQLLYEYFEPDFGDTFSIVDPYLEPYSHIQLAFDNGKVEQNIWAFFLSFISDEKINVNFITRQSLENLKNGNEDYPLKVYYPADSKNLTISMCQFKDGLYNKHELHDRWILKQSSVGICKGIHLGPSLSDIDKKDVTITTFSDNTILEANTRFEYLWDICLKQRRT
jgi:hypothetical protein